MQEPEVSLRVAMDYIRRGKACADINVSIDGAHGMTETLFSFKMQGR